MHGGVPRPSVRWLGTQLAGGISDECGRCGLAGIRSVEERNPQLAAEVYHDDLEFHWPRPLPYAGSSYGLKASLERRPGWAETGNPFQSEAERWLGARVVAASEDEVVVLWHQRGRDRAGRWLDTPVLEFHQVRDGKLARAQMFYFDPLAAAEFLATSGRQMA